MLTLERCRWGRRDSEVPPPPTPPLMNPMKIHASLARLFTVTEYWLILSTHTSQTTSFTHLPYNFGQSIIMDYEADVLFLL